MPFVLSEVGNFLKLELWPRQIDLEFVAELREQTSYPELSEVNIVIENAQIENYSCRFICY